MFPVNDALDAILLGTFFFGLLFTVASMLLGFAHIGGDADTGHGHDGIGHHDLSSLLNVGSILGFLTWFGGIGYLLRNGAGLTALLSIPIAIAFGLAGAYVIAIFMNRILKAGDDSLDPHDFERVGVIARVSSSIRAGGVGEIVFEQGGTRQVAAARSEHAIDPITRGTEVVILKVDRGMAVVEPFEDLLKGTGGQR